MELLDNLNNDFLEKNFIKKLSDKDNPNIYLLKYDKEKSNTESIAVKQARGIILENNTNKIVCYSLNKFEDNDLIKKEDFDKWEFEEAIDGTQIRLYYYNDEWNVTTARRILAKNSKWNYVKTFYELFKDVEHMINYGIVNKNYTYTFILKHIENRIISSVKKNELYHIHTRNNKTLEEFDEDIGIKKPLKFKFDSYDAFNEQLNELDFENKGFVVTYDSKKYMFNTKDYDKVKELKGNHLNINYNFIDLYRNDKLSEFLLYFPEYQLKFNDVERNIEILGNEIHNLYILKNVHKKIKLSNLKKNYRIILYYLHNIYITNKTVITREIVLEEIYKNISIYLLLNLLKFKD